MQAETLNVIVKPLLFDYWEQPNGLDSTLEASTLREAFQEIARYWKENSFIA